MLPLDARSGHHDRNQTWDRIHRAATEGTDPDAVLLVGEPGIGKSTVWSSAVAAARSSGACVLSTTAAEAESSMPYVVLGDLLAPVADRVFPTLPEPQREALEVVLLRVPDLPRSPSVRLIAMALQTALTSCEGPRVFLAIDDLQWVDPESQAVLAFALRRAADAPIRTLMTMRISGPFDWRMEPPPTNALVDVFRPDQWLTFGPMTPPAVRTMIKDRLGITFSLRDSELICEATMGNPAWAVELAGVWARDQHRPGAPVPAPGSLHAMMITRVRALEPDVIDALCVVSALGRPTVRSAVRALDGLVAEPARALDRAVTQGVVDAVEPGRLAARPLLSDAALQVVSPGRQHELFMRLVEIAESPEAKAHYMARTVDDSTPDEIRGEVATAFDAVVENARSRGAIGHAARLAEQALRLTAPSAPELDRRRITTARLHTECANFDRALKVMEPVDIAALPTPLLELALPTTAAVRYLVSGPDAARALIAGVAARHDPDPRRLALLHTLLADRFYGDFPRRHQHARDALHHAQQVGLDGFGTYRACLQLIEVQADSGDGLDRELVRRALGIAENLPEVAAPFSVDIYLARALIITDDMQGARLVLADSLDNARRIADDMRIAVLSMALAEAALLAGDAKAAAAALAESDEAAAWIRGEPTHKALLRGRLLLADGHADQVETMMTELAWTGSAHRTRRMAADYLFGMIAAQRGDHDHAVVLLRQALDSAESFGHHDTGARFRVDTDLGEQLIHAGRLPEAAAIGHRLLAAGEQGNRCTLRGIGHRLLGLCAAAEGDADTACGRLTAAVAEHAHSHLRPELGRSLLARARFDLNRPHLRPRAMDDLRRAAAIFTDVGLGHWHREVRTELEHATRTESTTSLLTASERRVVQAILDGATNRDAAESLHLGIRTVESHLAAAYRKLGVHSRRDLRAMFDSGEGAPW
ncbi:AAA family ATPase [Kutzneria sp. CA-103260]|uniref:AAA family ATPase n=1 Tax=Kutzneria sp. CA-103260 TaxID=2802641 RepID=UPI001BAA2D93|nr:LuxR family transcriptional regulator [Kutzneria sp. CA-103260]QUQ64336.1 LuxR family transcriptional regulator [Kutzneria sp. CA-103260]